VGKTPLTSAKEVTRRICAEEEMPLGRVRQPANDFSGAKTTGPAQASREFFGDTTRPLPGKGGVGKWFHLLPTQGVIPRPCPVRRMAAFGFQSPDVRGTPKLRATVERGAVLAGRLVFAPSCSFWRGPRHKRWGLRFRGGRRKNESVGRIKFLVNGGREV